MTEVPGLTLNACCIGGTGVCLWGSLGAWATKMLWIIQLVVYFFCVVKLNIVGLDGSTMKILWWLS